MSWCLVLLLTAFACSESVRETETWVPLRATQTAAMLAQRDLEGSASDFGFQDEDDWWYEDDDGDELDYTDFSGSGDGATSEPTRGGLGPVVKPEVADNEIPEEAPQTTADQRGVVRNNEILLLDREGGDEQLTNVLMSHTSQRSVLNKTEVLAALIAGGAIGLMFAVLLILLLIYRMKKKDEGSYDLGRKPIYTKAPTTEIYA